ncbi:hypothetical protein CKM354_000458100 [Cercospora kikuchii]|uniref:Uncharacterized protein n=1 Tax=Cercospora kikuchii TaxID=84275 RepID=A0A9P3CE58_9PEZI|nr:uncharacterized protein CKM354_000458100 [Cercospora kikuchii]GIZ41269.1 hypothetical protein CKM354_000458100 [Cercospora kikuchii]
MAAPWRTKGPIYEYSFYECKTGLATQWLLLPTSLRTPKSRTTPSQRQAGRKTRAKGRAIGQEEGEEEAQLGSTTHATSSEVGPPTEPSSIGSDRTREGAARLERSTTASAALAPSRKVAKSEEHRLQWNEEMKLCLWVMEEAFGTQLVDWGRKVDVWNYVFKNQQVFQDGQILSGSRKASERQLRAQLSEHVKAKKVDQAHKPAIKQWVDIKAMDKQGEGFQAMERKVQAAIAALDEGRGWTR